jgi:hypothetical protein
MLICRESWLIEKGLEEVEANILDRSQKAFQKLLLPDLSLLLSIKGRGCPGHSNLLLVLFWL